MLTPRNLSTWFVALAVVFTPLCFSEEVQSEESRREALLKTFVDMRADKRLKELTKLYDSKEQRSIETLYTISVRDPAPDVRSRAFYTLVHCDDTFSYTAYLAADSFRQERELGVKIEKAVAMGTLRYKWSALNELVTFLSTLRWSDWNWGWYYGHGLGHTGGYIASGNPPEDPSESSGRDSGYEGWRNREPLRWRNENELMDLVATVINRLSGTQMESRPRIDQEIVRWWAQKSDLWAEYDRKLRTKTIESLKEAAHNQEMRKAAKPAPTDPEQDYRGVLKIIKDAKDDTSVKVEKKRPVVTPQDE